jgi:uronate dehydrogenase
MTRVLLTGAAGRVGRLLHLGLTELGWTVRGYDRVSPDTPTPSPTSEWVVGDITDPGALAEAMTDVDAVVHLAGIPDEAPFTDLLTANIDGTYQVFHAAQRAGVGRVVYASSNHAVGYHRRTASIDVDVRPRPDSVYGVTKVFGEALGSYFADRHGMEVACVRIGSCFPNPTSVRMLSTWLSPDDTVRLFHALLAAPDLTYAVVYGTSANTRGWWDLRPARRLGYQPRDDAEVYASEVLASCGPLASDDLDHVLLGGRFTSSSQFDQ